MSVMQQLAIACVFSAYFASITDRRNKKRFTAMLPLTRARVAASPCIIVPALSVSKDLFDGDNDAALLCGRVKAELGLRRHCSQLFPASCGLATPPNMALNTAKLAS